MNDLAGNIVLKAVPISRLDFSQFGQVIDIEGSGDLANQGHARRYCDAAKVDFDGNGGPCINLFLCEAEVPPVRLRVLERHPRGSQAFVPIDGQRFIVVVARGDDRPDMHTLRAFVCAKGVGINYNRGTWHHPLIALDGPCRFLEVSWKGSLDNLDEVQVGEQIIINVVM